MPHKENISDTGYDPVWNEIYENGHEQKAPWDMVVSFVYHYRPRNKDIKDIRLLEVGCGTASNLRFFAKEGFDVSGIDASPKAISIAKKYFSDNSLKGRFNVGSFDNLPFKDEFFDMVIDRAALTHAGDSIQKTAINEIYRVLNPKGCFLYTPYADTHTSNQSGEKFKDGLVKNIKSGTLQNVGHMRFMSQKDIQIMLPFDQWNFLSMEYETRQNILNNDNTIHSGWRIVVEKK